MGIKCFLLTDTNPYLVVSYAKLSNMCDWSVIDIIVI